MPIRVLIVDDDTAFRSAAAALLGDYGYVVAGEAGSVADARAAIARLRPDALLLDVQLPDGNGIAFATELSEGPRILLTSSDPGAATPRLITRCGAAGFVAKADLIGVDLGRYLG